MRIWINNDVIAEHNLNPDDSTEMVDYLQNNYFNGADNAVIYIGESKLLGIQEFEIIPN
jgi:hypothetical protein